MIIKGQAFDELHGIVANACRVFEGMNSLDTHHEPRIDQDYAKLAMGTFHMVGLAMNRALDIVRGADDITGTV
jgi:hypothetical protein